MLVFNQTKIEKCEEILGYLVSWDTRQPEGNEKEIVDYIEMLFGDTVEKEVYLHSPKRASLVLKFDGEQKDGGIAFVGHLDTVSYENPDDWKYNPLEAVVEDGVMYGRGTADMKSGVCAMILAALYLQEQKVKLKKPVYFCFTADEERGGIGIQKIIESGILNTIDAAIICEPSSRKIGIGEKGALWLQVTATGAAAHGSNPSAGTNALDCLIEIKTMLDSYMTKENGDSMLGKSTISLTKMNGGTGTNIIPVYGSMELDIRTIPETKNSEILEFLETACKEVQRKNREFKYGIHILNNRGSVCTKEDNPFVQDFKTAVESLEIEANCAGLKYYTDASQMIPPLNIPFIIFGPGEAEQAHKTNEHVSLHSVKECSDIYITYLINYCGGRI
ncbi:M20 family metallopeptidase [Roseburia hominis]